MAENVKSFGALSRSCALLAVFVFIVFSPLKASADEAELRAQIAALQAQNAALRDQLAACAGQSNASGADVLALMRKLGQQQKGGADLALGFGGGPLILPEALLRSVVPNEYIVLLADGSQRPESAAEVATLYGIGEAQVLHVYQQALAGFAVRISEAERARIEALPEVLGVAQNGRVFSTGAIVRPSLHRLESRAYVPAANHVQGIDVYLFDTGIRRAHRDLDGRVRESGFSFFDNGIAGEDCSGHGTHVAARIAGNRLGTSRAARLTSVKVIDRFGTGDVATVIAGIDWVMSQGDAPKLVNMSLTRMVTEDPSPLDLAVKALIASGAVVVVAAGNAAADAADFTPARIEDAITVGSFNEGALSGFSNAGESVDIYAPGEAILSASIRDICGVQEMSGTSMAAPYVTGLLADMMVDGVKAPALVDALRADARRISTGAFAGETERYVLQAGGGLVAGLCFE